MRTLVTTLAMTSGLFCVASIAHAQNVNFNITGTITAGTCNVAINGGAPLNVGTFNQGLFTGDFQSGFVSVNLNYTCSSGISTLSFVPSGTPDATPGGNRNYFDSTLPGAPFELKINSSTVDPTSGKKISIGDPGTSGTVPLAAQFHQTAPLTKTGVGSSTVTLNVSYQ